MDEQALYDSSAATTTLFRVRTGALKLVVSLINKLRKVYILHIPGIKSYIFLKDFSNVVFPPQTVYILP